MLFPVLRDMRWLSIEFPLHWRQRLTRSVIPETPVILPRSPCPGPDQSGTLLLVHRFDGGINS
jgi:hypothetical protein